MRPRLLLKYFCMFVAVMHAGSVPMAGASSLARYLDGSGGADAYTDVWTTPDEIRMAMAAGDGHEAQRKQASRLNMSSMHKYLGYGALVFAAAAAVSGGDTGFHKAAGGGTAIMAMAASATGYYEYGHYFNPDDGFSRYNIHIVLATLATIGFAVTAASAISDDNDDHAAPGIVSTGLAAVPILLLKF